MELTQQTYQDNPECEQGERKALLLHQKQKLCNHFVALYRCFLLPGKVESPAHLDFFC